MTSIAMDAKTIEALASGEPDPHTWFAVVSYNTAGDGGGFWHGDLFFGDCEVPDAFFTLKHEGTRAQAVERASEKWPHAVIHIEDECIECAGLGVVYDEDEEECPMCDGYGTSRTVWSGK